MSLVPSVEMEKNITLPNGNSISVDDTRYFPIPFGGDQMTVAIECVEYNCYVLQKLSVLIGTKE